jgi:hypothetical protein
MHMHPIEGLDRVAGAMARLPIADRTYVRNAAVSCCSKTIVQHSPWSAPSDTKRSTLAFGIGVQNLLPATA